MELKISLVQTDVVWEDAEANLAGLQQKIKRAAPLTDVIVLPEMFSTGFSMNAAQLAEPMDGRAVQWMAAQAKAYQCVVTGSLIIAENGQYYNRLVWMRPDGTFEKYDKCHSFSLTNEPKIFTEGTQKLVVNHNGWKICPQICYDLRFPVWNRNDQDFDLYINVANWPAKRSFAWKTLLRARAIENQVFVVGVNRYGEDGHGFYHSGDSTVVDPLGKTITEISDREEVQTVSISRSVREAIIQKYPFINDRDQFTINQ
jgi:predicted amidohydrolase